MYISERVIKEGYLNADQVRNLEKDHRLYARYVDHIRNGDIAYAESILRQQQALLKSISPDDRSHKFLVNTVDAMQNFFLKHNSDNIVDVKNIASSNTKTIELLSSEISKYKGITDTIVKYTKYAGITSVIVLIAYLAYSVYKYYKTRTNPENAIKKSILKLRQYKSYCKNTTDPDKCRKKVDEMIEKWEEKTEKYKNKS